jgi:hypothetical protein
MHSQKILSICAKLNTLDAKKKASLLSYLPESVQIALSAPQMPQTLIPVKMTIQKLVKRVDISHYKHFLDTLNEGEKTLYTAAFPKYKQVELNDKTTPFIEFTTEKFGHHVLNMLFQKMFAFYPPPSILPLHPALELLADTGVLLSKLTFFLGLFDATEEIKKIISKEILFSLQKAFSKEEMDYMNVIGMKKRGLILSSMNLAAYTGDIPTLRSLILERGIYRLAQGIKGAPAEYRFFFTYFLPKNSSDTLLTLFKQKELFAPRYTHWEEDTLDTWRFLCTYSK